MITETRSSTRPGPAGLCGTAGVLFVATLGSVTAGLVSPGAVAAQTPHTEHTVLLAPNAESPHARIRDFAFLEGSWVGEGLGGTVDEVWSRGLAGTMAGAFRLVQEGKVLFYEFMALEEEARTVALRIKHFNPGPGLPGWEARDEETLFRLVRVDGAAAWFHGLTFQRPDPDTLVVHLALRSRDRSVREEELRFRRAGPWLPGRPRASARDERGRRPRVRGVSRAGIRSPAWRARGWSSGRRRQPCIQWSIEGGGFCEPGKRPVHRR